uniref:Uncharacterized protein n=1 Tax=Cyprinus carpio TaxID=7962 RepID=A0A8C2JDL6_CYPCA
YQKKQSEQRNSDPEIQRSNISFIKNHGNVATKKETTRRLSFSNESKGFVIFYIKTKGGKKVKRLMKNNELRKKVEDVCVYAFKDDKLNAALRRDGRFINAIFKKQCVLYNLESETKYEMSKTAEHLDGKHFEIIVINDNNQPDSQDFALTHIRNGEEDIRQVASTLPGRNKTKKMQGKMNVELLVSLVSEHKELYDKRDSDYKNLDKRELVFLVFLFYIKRHLMSGNEFACSLGSSSAKIAWVFILTNAHVVGEFDPFTRKLSKTFTAVFGYEDLEAKKTRCVPVKEHLAAYYHGNINTETYLDFALLELKDADEMADCPGLLSRYIHGPPPNRGGICIVGHPGEGVKKMDPCFIIGKENLQEAADKHISENVNFIHVMTQQSLAEKWEMHDNQIIYNTCFFHGSSGSPVFDEDCYLIGVHTGGYAYKGENCKTRSIMEYAYSIEKLFGKTQVNHNRIFG